MKNYTIVLGILLLTGGLSLAGFMANGIQGAVFMLQSGIVVILSFFGIVFIAHGFMDGE